MKTAIVESRCECQAKLGANLDERRQVVRGWARDRRTGQELGAPAHTIGGAGEQFQVAWACPLCTRNQTRPFAASALVYRDGQGD